MVVYIAAGSGRSTCKERRVVWNRGRWDQMQQAAGLLGGCLLATATSIPSDSIGL